MTTALALLLPVLAFAQPSLESRIAESRSKLDALESELKLQRARLDGLEKELAASKAAAAKPAPAPKPAELPKVELSGEWTDAQGSLYKLIDGAGIVILKGGVGRITAAAFDHAACKARIDYVDAAGKPAQGLAARAGLPCAK